MIKAVLIEDELHIRELIKRKLAHHFDDEITVVGEAGDVQSALSLISKVEPRLVFLDIQLLDGSGFDVVEKSTFKNFSVIFITAYDNQAIKAVKMGALDYILKPINNDEFIGSVSKAIINIGKKEYWKQVVLSIENTPAIVPEKKRVTLKTSDLVYTIEQDDILYCKADNNYVTIYLLKQKAIVISKTIKKLEGMLFEEDFIRCHKSYLVNKKHAQKYSKKGFLILRNDIKVPVSSRRKEYVMKEIFYV